MDTKGLEDSAILLMSLGEEEASEVFKLLAPKEVQALGETIAKMKSIPRERVDGVLERFAVVASEQSMLVSDTDEYVKSVLRKALGDDKANLLIDRILQGGDISGIESLKWMDAGSVAELLRNEHPCTWTTTSRRRCSSVSPNASATRCSCASPRWTASSRPR
jgi:flagellar motor switch protein FliG